MTESEERQSVVTAALGWLGTPYRHMGRVKGPSGGVDCATLLAEVYAEAGVVDRVKIEPYPPDWHLHRSEERYVEIVSQYAREIEGPPGPGDIVLWRFGRCFSHGAIVIAWPAIVHAYLGAACVTEDAAAAAWLCVMTETRAERGQPRPRRFFSRWGGV